MLVFRAKLFDGFLRGTENVFTQVSDSELLAAVERVTLGLVWSGVTVASGTPTITLRFQNSPDGTRWIDQSATPELDSATVALGDSFQYATNFASTTIPIAGYVRIRLAMGVTGGSSPAGYLRLWAVGRSPAF